MSKYTATHLLSDGYGDVWELDENHPKAFRMIKRNYEDTRNQQNWEEGWNNLFEWGEASAVHTIDSIFPPQLENE